MGMEMFVPAMTMEDCMVGRRVVRPVSWSLLVWAFEWIDGRIGKGEAGREGRTTRGVVVGRTPRDFDAVFVSARPTRGVTFAYSAGIQIVEVAEAS